MKKLVKVEEIEGEGFTALLGENIIVFSLNYIYTGKLVGVNETCILLDDAAIVYETGAFSEKKFKDAQKLGHSLYLQVSTIESFGTTIKLV